MADEEERPATCYPMSIASQQSAELLAPAGSVEAFFAAMEAGADAVYCGLKSFSARAKAKNFSLAEMENLCAYAHKQGRKLYIPLNTLIKEEEQAELIEILDAVASFKVDGLIVQDLGVYHIIHTFFPEIPLHASTQMAVHNLAGVQMLEQMGFERAVLARELSLPEIKTIRQGSHIELEHFIHGALCFSVSGHCLFSSFQTGQSGNRGGCAQPCRRRYSQDKQEQFTFSTSDLNSLSLLPQLAKNGIMSFKIEGRMKNAEYVWNVVRAYRQVLDSPEADLPHATQRGEEILAHVHGRQTTAGFLSTASQTILLPHQKGGIGKPAGYIKEITGKAISFTNQTKLHVGDKIRVHPQTDKPGTAFTIREMRRGKKRIKQSQKGQQITIQTPFPKRFSPGDQIFKISTGRGFTLSEAACHRRLTTAPKTPTQIHLHMHCSTESFSITALAPIPFKQQYEVETFAAEKSPLTLATLTAIFKKTAHPEVELGDLQGTDFPQVVIKPSRLKTIRRDFYTKFCDELHRHNTTSRQKRLQSLSQQIAPPHQSAPHQPRQLYLVCDRPHKELQHLKQTCLILPVAAPAPPDTDCTCIWDLPALVYQKHWPELQRQVKEKQAQGYSRFRLNNIGHFKLFKPADPVQLMAGPALYCLNHNARKTLEHLNIVQMTFSIEDDQNNITSLSQYSQNCILPVYSGVTLMYSRIPMQSHTPINSKNGDVMTVHQETEVVEIQAATPFSLSGRLAALEKMGLHHFLIDLRHQTTNQRRAIMQAITQDQAIPNCTSFNFDRGLS